MGMKNTQALIYTKENHERSLLVTWNFATIYDAFWAIDDLSIDQDIDIEADIVYKPPVSVEHINLNVVICKNTD